MNRILLPLTLLAAVPALAQGGERRFEVGRFDAVELASSDRVEVRRGAAFTVSATGDPRAVATLAVSSTGGRLRVGRVPGSHRDKGATVTVTMPSLRAVSLPGSGSITVAPGTAAAEIDAQLSGSGRIALPGLAARSVRLDLGGSGDIAAGGRADRVAISLGGSGAIDARRLATPTLDVTLGGSGTIAATASRNAAIRAGGSGTVRVTGGAACDVARGGSATIVCG